MTKIAFGGSCHWCMEAIYQSLIGVVKVEQGFVASKEAPRTFYETVIVYFNPEQIPLKALVEIHLKTHKSTVNHSKRNKYVSAVYAFSVEQQHKIRALLEAFQNNSSEKIITKASLFNTFKPSEEMFYNYYYSNPEKPFCKTYIDPKLKKLLANYEQFTNKKLQSLVNKDNNEKSIIQN
ncbi:peptide-methionine (S)-S-oxide reductase [Galbibacter sp. PAP.153]|uniref:peptide-methionine (S)-S-oxide reductase n=1 Tax=Galbibacter sp. PAP.153 TaxID=3104623 RepID=UPI003009243C